MKHCANNIAVAFQVRPHDGLEYWISSVLKSWSNDWKPSEVAIIIIRAAKDAFGDPMGLTSDQLKLRQYANQYYNPSGHNINVEPLGLPDENGNIIKHVVPGGLVLIPHGYAIGGKKSAVYCVAPQLQPMEIISEQNNLLDVTPISYAEWLKYYPFQTSKCCNRPLLWSDAMQYIICQGCKQEVKFIYAK